LAATLAITMKMLDDEPLGDVRSGQERATDRQYEQLSVVLIFAQLAAKPLTVTEVHLVAEVTFYPKLAQAKN